VVTDFETWFERTFGERERELVRIFGELHPPGMIRPLSWQRLEHAPRNRLLPGACVAAFAPEPGGREHEKHDDWLYVTHALTQPEGPEAVKAARERGDKRSRYGFEFAVATESEEKDWPCWMLDLLVGYTFDGAPIAPGDWLAPFGFHRRDGVLGPFTGRHDELARVHKAEIAGEIAGVIFWPYIWRGPSYLATSTGSFGVLVATGVTHDELAYARGFSTRHVLLLLLECGVGQRTAPLRSSVLDDDANLDRWGRIAKLTPEEAERELGGLARR
jgi:hypothetical protein